MVYSKYSRSREGAWIEMLMHSIKCAWRGVAPARERGLKFQQMLPTLFSCRRSREGAWIEIFI